MKWINIKEQAPPMLEDILVSKVDFVAFGYLTKIEDTIWFQQVNDDALINRALIPLTHLTHWMPMPEPVIQSPKLNQ